MKLLKLLQMNLLRYFLLTILLGGFLYLFTTPNMPFIQPENIIPILFITGNLIAKNQTENGWSSHLQKYFDSKKLAIGNLVLKRRGSHTFFTQS